MVRYKKTDARAWARDNMKGVANVVISRQDESPLPVHRRRVGQPLGTVVEEGVVRSVFDLRVVEDVVAVVVVPDEATKLLDTLDRRRGGPR